MHPVPSSHRPAPVHTAAMPEFLAPDAVEFQLHDGAPLLRLALPAPAPDAADQWRFLNRATLCVLDGPQQAGYLMSRFIVDGDAAPTGWDEAVANTRGVIVTFGTCPDAPRLFVRCIEET